MRTLRNVLVVGVLLCMAAEVMATEPVATRSAEFYIFRVDMDNDGSVDQFSAEINIRHPNVTGVQLITGTDTANFTDEGLGNFWFEGYFESIDALNSEIVGTHKLRISHTEGVGEYSFTIGLATLEMFANFATLDAVGAEIPQQYTFGWSWSGEADAMGLGAEIDNAISLDDDSMEGSLIVGTSTSFTADFGPHTGPGGFEVGYGKLLNPTGDSGLIRDFGLTSGTGLLFDSVVGIVASDTEIEFTVVPEPASMTLLIAGLAGMMLRRRRA